MTIQKLAERLVSIVDRVIFRLSVLNREQELAERLVSIVDRTDNAMLMGMIDAQETLNRITEYCRKQHALQTRDKLPCICATCRTKREILNMIKP